MDRDNPIPADADADADASRRRALSAGRLDDFLREPPRDGNIAVMLPDCTPNVKINRKQKKETMNDKIELFRKKFES